MRLAGVIFVLASTWSVGHRIASGLKTRCDELRRFMDALQILRSELSYFAAPLPEAFRAMAEAAERTWRDRLLDMAASMEQDRWLSPSAAAERSLVSARDEPLREIFLRLTEKLGSYDLEAQLCGIDRAADMVHGLLTELDAERKLKSRTYKTLSLCAGSAVVILLI